MKNLEFTFTVAILIVLLLNFNGKTLIGFLLLQIAGYGSEMAIFSHIVVISHLRTSPLLWSLALVKSDEFTLLENVILFLFNTLRRRKMSQDKTLITEYIQVTYKDLIISQCTAVSLHEQLEHVARRRLESQKNIFIRKMIQDDDIAARRHFAPGASIIGVPSLPSHLPPAEPILPGHTLLRPALGMLKSAIKFPHRDMENGAGVYGNVDKLGIRYDGVNERVLYTGFRRVPSNYIMILPQKRKGEKSVIFIGAPITVDSERFTPDPKSLVEILENRVETDRAMRQFFKKSSELQVGYHDEMDNKPPRKVMTTGDYSSSSSEEAPIHHLDKTSEEGNEEADDKKTWFSKTKNAYNHVKFNSHAPDITDLMPLEIEDFVELRNWWFFNQDDFKALKDVGSDFESTTKKASRVIPVD